MSKQEPIVIKNSAPHQVSFSEATGKATRKSNFLNDDSENATQERVSIPPQNAPGPADPTLLNAADSSATPPAQTLAAQAGAQVRAHVAGPVTAMTQTVQTPQPVRPAATPQTSQPMHAPSVAAANLRIAAAGEDENIQTTDSSAAYAEQLRVEADNSGQNRVQPEAHTSQQQPTLLSWGARVDTPITTQSGQAAEHSEPSSARSVEDVARRSVEPDAVNLQSCVAPAPQSPAVQTAAQARAAALNNGMIITISAKVEARMNEVELESARIKDKVAALTAKYAEMVKTVRK